jgi:SWI/SNF-related matrix-associated actin-dependent regulator 1 of chromatin subfamily A
VNVHFLLVRDSIDDLMWELLQNKLTITGQVLDGEATRMEVRKQTGGYDSYCVCGPPLSVHTQWP